MTNLDCQRHLRHQQRQSRDIALLTKVRLVKATIFPVVMYGHESWTIKKAERQRTDACELWFWRKLLKSTMDGKEIKPVNPKGNQSWIFIGRTDAEAEALILWAPDAKNKLIGKDPEAGKEWGQEEKGTTEDEMVGWHHQLSEFTQTHVHWVGDDTEPSHPLSSSSPPAFNLSQHQGLFQWVSSSHQVAKVLEFQLQHQSFQWIFRTDCL